MTNEQLSIIEIFLEELIEKETQVNDNMCDAAPDEIYDEENDCYIIPQEWAAIDKHTAWLTQLEKANEYFKSLQY